jgi:hypothetical protein
MIDKIFYKFFELVDKFFNWLYDRFICDIPKDKKKK